MGYSEQAECIQDCPRQAEEIRRCASVATTSNVGNNPMLGIYSSANRPEGPLRATSALANLLMACASVSFLLFAERGDAGKCNSSPFVSVSTVRLTR
jgi:hypothetical protein